MPRRRAHNRRVNVTAGERADKRRGTGKPARKPARKPSGATQGETAPRDASWYAAAIEDPEVPPDEPRPAGWDGRETGMDECTGEMIGGIWRGDGCQECRGNEADAIEADVESGNIDEDEATLLHQINGSW